MADEELNESTEEVSEEQPVDDSVADVATPDASAGSVAAEGAGEGSGEDTLSAESEASDVVSEDVASQPADVTQPAETADGIDVAQGEEEIRQELGIGGGKIEIDQTEVERLLGEAVVGYEQIFAGTVLDPSLPVAGEATSVVGDDSSGADVVSQNLGLLRDVNMKVKVELGRGRMYLKDILRLAQGSVVELERLAGDPLDIYVNEKVIARGEVLVLNENFCIRITEIFSPAEVLAQEV